MACCWRCRTAGKELWEAAPLEGSVGVRYKSAALTTDALGELCMNTPLDPQITQAFWDEARSKSNLANLTGSNLPEELGKLRALPMALPGKRVLNIGVGLGFTTMGLAEMGCEVYQSISRRSRWQRSVTASCADTCRQN